MLYLFIQICDIVIMAIMPNIERVISWRNVLINNLSLASVFAVIRQQLSARTGKSAVNTIHVGLLSRNNHTYLLKGFYHGINVYTI